MNPVNRVPLIIAGIYCLLGAAWILLSGTALKSLFHDPSDVIRGEFFKGFFYVAATSLLLYWLVRRYVRKLVKIQRALERENSESRQTQILLKESEEQFYKMFAGNSAVMFLVDPESLSLIDANDAACRFYGYSESYFKTLRLTDLIMMDEDEARRRMRSAESCEGRVEDLQKHRLADGSLRDMELYATRICLTNKEFIFAIVHDVTDRVQSERSLVESEVRFRSLVETTTDWIWATDADHRLTYSSPRILDVLGYLPHEVIGKTPFELMAQPDAAKVRHYFEECRNDGKPVSGIEHNNFHKDGRIVILESNWVPAFDAEGNFSGCRGIDRDITVHRQLEEQLRHAQKMNAIGELTGGIAHDFNNILTTIIGYIYILQTRIADEDLKKFVDQLDYSAQRAVALVGKLLAFGRKQIISLQPMKINEAITKANGLFSRLIRENIEIRTDLCPEDITVLADEGQIEQVIMNLVTNAGDAMPDGGVLTIRTERFLLDKGFVDTRGYGKPGLYALVSFSDTGVGMDEKTRERIFEPFFTTKEVGKGTGLGLSIVYGIIKQHNGFVEVQSEVGRGTRFDLFFPVAESSPAGTGPQGSV